MSLKLGYVQTEKWPKNFSKGLSDLTFDDLKGQVIGLDIESGGADGLDPWNPGTYMLCVAISGRKVTFVLDQTEFAFKPGLKLIQKVVESEECMVVGHNIKFDLTFLSVQYGWKIRCMAYDTGLAAYFLNEDDAWIKLEKLTERYGIYPGYKQNMDRSRLEDYNRDDVLIYNSKDAHSVMLLKDIFDPKLEEHGLEKIMNVACQAIPVLSAMTGRGVMVDFDYARQQQMKLYKQLIDFKLGLKELAGRPFKVDSPKDLGNVLFGRMGFSPVRVTDSGHPSVDYESLLKFRQEQCGTNPLNFNYKEPHVIEFLDKLLKYSKLVGLNEKYYNKLGKEWVRADNCVHTNWNIGVTDTGRLSSSGPNMQSVKRGGEFRGCFIARPGYALLEGDLSQVELRFAALFSGEDQMLRMFEEGVDIHTKTLCDIQGWNYEEIDRIYNDHDHPDHLMIKNVRVGIKNLNFGEFYGATEYRLQREMVKNGIYWTIEECRELFDKKKALTPKAQIWKKKIAHFVINHGYVRMPFGQIRRLPDASWKTSEGREAIRQAINFIIQSSASGWFPVIGMILIDNYFRMNSIDAHILLNVHDSVLCEVKRGSKKFMDKIKRDIRKIMEVDTKEFVKEFFNFNITVPLEFKCDYLERWQ